VLEKRVPNSLPSDRFGPRDYRITEQILKKIAALPDTHPNAAIQAGGPLLSKDRLESMILELWPGFADLLTDKARIRHMCLTFAQWGWDDRDQQVHGLLDRLRRLQARL
jgi:hypothetical protein